ncbi:hypothetical protein [Streptomyces achromogenes]
MAAPQAVAVDQPAVPISERGDAATRALVQSDPQAVAAAATVCGTGYPLFRAVPLPARAGLDQRLATPFSHENGSKGCTILDNNVGASQYMYLHVCEIEGTGCDTGSENFTQYAGPVYVANSICSPVTAKMGANSSNLYIDLKTDYMFIYS